MKSLIFPIIAATLICSCGESDVFNSKDAEKYREEQHKKDIEQYQTNFEKKYGKVPSDANWDFTSGEKYYLASGASSKAVITPAISSGNIYQVQDETISWLKENVPESQNNRAKGSPFFLTMPGNSFTIVPIYQGEAGMIWDLYMVTGEGEEAKKNATKIWTKSQGIETSEDGITWINIDSGSKGSANAQYVRGKEIVIDGIPANTPVYFYLKITYGVTNWADTGTEQSSLGGMMLALDCPRPSNIDEEKKVMIIGCEDSNGTRSDWDLNDIVFLVYGNPEIPNTIKTTDGQTIQSISKRYMIEDLGSTDDFDFNDIVVDVQAKRDVTFTYTNGVLSNTQYGEWKDETATVRHLGGTLDFKLQIGNTSISNLKPSLDSNPDKEYSITGWNPDSNNISVEVDGKASTGVYKIGFPKTGEIPMILAFDYTKNWMSERESIPQSWFTEN